MNEGVERPLWMVKSMQDVRNVEWSGLPYEAEQDECMNAWRDPPETEQGEGTNDW
jgi:hypothetical protein